MSDRERPGPSLTPAQQVLNDLWEEHIRDEFATRDTEAGVETARKVIDHSLPSNELIRRAKGRGPRVMGRKITGFPIHRATK